MMYVEGARIPISCDSVHVDTYTYYTMYYILYVSVCR